jgi:hypothetical protein
MGFMGLYMLLGILFLFLVHREIDHGPDAQPISAVPEGVQ